MASPPGASQTFSLNTVISDTVPAGGFSFSGAAGTTVGGTVATITDPNTSATASAYSATINWGDGDYVAGDRHRQQRQLHGDRKPRLRRRRDVPGRGHDHIRRHQPGKLDRQRLGDDHRRADDRSNRRAVGRPPPAPGFTGSVNPDGLRDDRVLPVRA